LLFMESEEPLRSTTGPKGRKYIARGETPGKEIKDNQPRRGDTITSNVFVYYQKTPKA